MQIQTNHCKLTIVVPCYNEEEIVQETTRQLSGVLELLIQDTLIDSASRILYVDDGSQDSTWSIITSLSGTNAYVHGLKLAGNVGHQRALWAGLTHACKEADIILSIDADLQDDISIIRDMVMEYLKGNDIVYGVRSSRQSDSWFKRNTALSFYRVINALGVKSVFNHADFRLMSNRAVSALLRFTERNLFIRGLVPLVGFQSSCVYYERKERIAGESKYPLSKMLGLAFDGVTSFSVKPVHFVLYLGVFFVIVASLILGWTLYSFFVGSVVPGWASLMVSLWFCTGCILIGLGIIGEYIGKIYIEVKHRPHFIVEEELPSE